MTPVRPLGRVQDIKFVAPRGKVAEGVVEQYEPVRGVLR